ncbi:MAG: AAA family ATPase [Deltaproteobacteria bacterium]|nr:AAA family ATPase [Deltaproteobacteria bacterium]
MLSSVHAAFDGVRSGGGRALLLLGEAGIGKTRVADEISQLGQASGVRPIGARCHEMEGAPALWPWIQVVRQLCSGLEPAVRSAMLGDDAQSLATLLPELAPKPSQNTSQLGPHDGDDRYRIFDSVTSLLRRVASEAPLLIVLDDLHWSDPASVLLTRYAVRELRRDPVVFLGLYRDTDVDPGDPLHRALGDLTLEAEAFRLEGLGPSEVADFVEHVAGFAVSDVITAALHAQTGGNPLFLVEMLRLLASEGRLGAPDSPTPEAIPLPLTVRHTLQRRLELLTTDTRTILEQAAILGSEFEPQVLEAAIQPDGDSSSALDEASTARLIQRVPGVRNRFRFAHDLIRETLDANLSIGDRALLHRRAADAIAKTRAATLEDHYATLAHHYLESASTGTAREAVDFATRGGARATATFSFELAVQLFEGALRALDFLDAESGTSSESEQTRATILVDMGHALWQSGQRQESQAAHRAAAGIARQLDDPSLLAQAAIGLAGRNDVPMDFPDASVQLMEQALEALPRCDSRLRVRLLAHIVRAKYFGDDREQLLEWAREAVAIATRLDDPGALFAALEALHYALLVPAHLEERLIVSKQLPELARRTGSLRFEALAWLWRTFDLLQVPDIAAADTAIARFEESARKLRQPFYEWLATGLRATRAQMEGRLDEAERLVFRALELGQRADSPNAFMFFGTQLFHLRVEQGRADELMPIMQKMVDESPALPVFRIGIPLIHSLADRREETRRSFEQIAAHDFKDVPHDLHRLPMLTSAAVVCAYLGDARRAEILLQELQSEEGRIIVAGVATYWGGSVDRCLGQLEATIGRLDEADRHFASAAGDAARAGARLIEAHTLSDRARVVYLRNGPDDPGLAAKLEEQAAEIYRELGIARDTASESSHVRRATPTNNRNLSSNRFLRQDRSWLLEYDGVQVELPDSKGLAYLQRLVATPDEDVHVVELIAPDPSEESRSRSDPHGFASSTRTARLTESPIEVLDANARRAYRERLGELESLRNEAERDHDLARANAIDTEREQIESELMAAVGLGGRPRSANNPAERARKAVYNRVRATIQRIEREHPALGRHLAGSVRTGTTCCYRPDRPTEWLLD